MFVQKSFVCLEIGSSLRREKGFAFLSRRHISCTVVLNHECIRNHAASGQRCFYFRIPNTLCHFTIMNHFYEGYTDDNCQSRLLQRIMSYLILPLWNDSHLVGLTTAKIKILMLPVKVKVTLWLAVYSQPVRLGVRPLETHDQRFFPTELLR
jgi:hypothetical protein